MAEQYLFSRLVPDGQLLVARTQHRLGHRPQAQATLERLLERAADDPSRPEALALLGQIYEDTGVLRRAFQTFQQFGEAFPRHPFAAGALAHSRQSLAKLPAAQRPPPDPEPSIIRRRQDQRTSLEEPSAPRPFQPSFLSWLPKPLVTLVDRPSGGQRVALKTEEFSQRLVREVPPTEPPGQSL